MRARTLCSSLRRRSFSQPCECVRQQCPQIRGVPHLAHWGTGAPSHRSHRPKRWHWRRCGPCMVFAPQWRQKAAAEQRAFSSSSSSSLPFPSPPDRPGPRRIPKSLGLHEPSGVSESPESPESPKSRELPRSRESPRSPKLPELPRSLGQARQARQARKLWHQDEWRSAPPGGTRKHSAQGKTGAGRRVHSWMCRGSGIRVCAQRHWAQGQDARRPPPQIARGKAGTSPGREAGVNILRKKWEWGSGEEKWACPFALGSGV
jgi:hypothetical protein